MIPTISTTSKKTKSPISKFFSTLIIIKKKGALTGALKIKVVNRNFFFLAKELSLH